MDRQQEFVLRTLEERDIRFVRLWFTDVLGFLKSVAVAPAELEGAFAEGIGFDGSAIEGFARVYESDMVARPDPATFQVLPWEDPRGPPLRGAHVLRHRHAGRVTLLGGPPSRAATDPRQGERVRVHLLRASRDRVLPAQRGAARTAASPCPRTTAATSTRPATPPRHTFGDTRSRPSRRWASQSSSATTRAPPASRRSTCGTRTR